MKKLFCLLLVLLFVPIVAFSDDLDPIVGCWYMYYDKAKTPEMESLFENYDKLISIYIFNESGVVYIAGASIAGTEGTPEYTPAGKWEKTGDSYRVSLIGFVENALSYCEDDSLLISPDESTGAYMRFKKLYYFNPYQDIVRK